MYMKPAFVFLACIGTVASENLYLWNAKISCTEAQSENISSITVQRNGISRKYKLFAPGAIAFTENTKYGHGVNGMCLDGFYKDLTSEACHLCPIGHWCHEGNKIKCPIHRTTEYMAASNEADCAVHVEHSDTLRCEPGHFGRNCDICPLGFFCNGRLKQPCPLFSTTLQRASVDPRNCTCDLGFVQNLYKSSVVCIPEKKQQKTSMSSQARVSAAALVWENRGLLNMDIRQVALYGTANIFQLEITRTSGAIVAGSNLPLCDLKPQCKAIHMDVTSGDHAKIQIQVITVSVAPAYLSSEQYTVNFENGRILHSSIYTPDITWFESRGYELYFTYIAVRGEVLAAKCAQTRSKRVEIIFENSNISTVTEVANSSNTLEIVRNTTAIEPFEEINFNITTNFSDFQSFVGVNKDCDLVSLNAHTFNVLQRCTGCVSEEELENAYLSEDGEHIVVHGKETLSFNHNFTTVTVNVDNFTDVDRFQVGTTLNFSHMQVSFLQISSTTIGENAVVFFSYNASETHATRQWKIQSNIPNIVYYTLYELSSGRRRVGTLYIQHTLYPLLLGINVTQKGHSQQCLHGYLWGLDTYSSACVPCPQNHLCRDGKILKFCPHGTLNHRCSCSPGTYWNLEAFDCVNATRGWFTNTTNQPPIKCPEHSSTENEGASSLTMCTVCDSGYYYEPEELKCKQASKGFFVFDGQQVACADTQTTLGVGSSSHADCVCKPRYFFNGTACEICDVDESCPVNTIGTPIRCVQNELQIYKSGKCGCKPGFTKNVLTNRCEAVERGFYVNEQIGLARTRCPAGLTTVRPGQSSLFNCVCSEVGRVKRENTMHCVCDTRHYQVDGQCTPCPPNMHTGGRYDANLISDCICLDGYEKNTTSGLCQLCEIGYFCKHSKKYACPIYTYGIMYGQTSIEDCIECSTLLQLNQTKYTLPTRVGAQTNPPFLGCALDVGLRKRTRDWGSSTGYYEGMTGFHTLLSRTMLTHNDVLSTLNGYVLELQETLKEFLGGYNLFEVVNVLSDNSVMRIDIVPYDNFFAHLFSRLSKQGSWSLLRSKFYADYSMYIRFASSLLCDIVINFFQSRISGSPGMRVRSECTFNSVYLNSEFDTWHQFKMQVFSLLNMQDQGVKFITKDPMATRDIFNILGMHLRDKIVVVPLPEDQFFIVPKQNYAHTHFENNLKSAVSILEPFDFQKVPCNSSVFELLHQPSDACAQKYEFHNDFNVCQRCNSVHQYFDKSSMTCSTCSVKTCSSGQTRIRCCGDEDTTCKLDATEVELAPRSSCQNNFHELGEECDHTDTESLLSSCCSLNCTLLPGFYRFPPCNTICGDGIKARNSTFEELCNIDT